MSELSNILKIDGSGAVLVVAHGGVPMVTLKADLAKKATGNQIKKSLGAALPEARKINAGIAWMAPDELLIFVQDPQSPEGVMAALETTIKTPILAVDVSDARAVFTLRGKGVREVLAKGAPVDLSPEAFGLGDFRRTRLGQVAVGFWMVGEDEFKLVCFASMRDFMFDWLVNAAQKHSLPEYL